MTIIDPHRCNYLFGLLSGGTGATLGSAAGQSIGLAQQQLASEAAIGLQRGGLTFVKEKPEPTLREELQTETDEWLNGGSND